ncbi:MAG: E1 ubiquitin-activating protein uba2 [Candelina mexicana]|nr:MAG: E1 ubiquitin-activating protein uba2 [Candelina mexicana]
MGREKYPRQSLGSIYGRIKEARILMVGAGGIGCELLKNLVLTGFGEIHIVDLDTIDLSNLNRQFLFRHEHIKKSKALVAKDAAGKFNPNVKLEAHHANIKDPEFNVEWFKGFTIVFNALDNLDARRHVNKMCLAADIPLIESGTTGFNGQVQVIKKGKTECYDCNTKEAPKSFPVCTIRSTPSQPIHCIVWAKSYLFTEIFGTSEDEAPELDHTEDGQNANEIENLRHEAQALKQIRRSMGTADFPRKVFEKVFSEDIHRLRSMEDMWKSKRRPEALDYDRVSKSASDLDPIMALSDQTVWSLAQNFAVFANSLQRLSKRLQEAQASTEDGSTPAILTFDKDDADALDFVASSANLRSHIFAIDRRSRFDIKQMAGNIIPAIATTNAMTAGLCVLQAFKVMRDNLQSAKMVFLERSAVRVLNYDTLRPPKPDCPVCGVAQSTLVVDTARATLNDLVEDLLRLQLGYGEEFSVNSEVGTLYDVELEDNLPKKFTDLGIKGDSFLTVVDEDEENPRVNLVLAITEQSIPVPSKPIVVPKPLNVARKSRPTDGTQAEAPLNGVPQGNGFDKRRKRSLEDVGRDDAEVLKRAKVLEPPTNSREDNGVIPDDHTDGAILIDDD